MKRKGVAKEVEGKVKTGQGKEEACEKRKKEMQSKGRGRRGRAGNRGEGGKEVEGKIGKDIDGGK